MKEKLEKKSKVPGARVLGERNGGQGGTEGT